MKKVMKLLLIAAVILVMAFLTGRYGWKLFGFSACGSAGIENVEVTDGQVRITGFYPGSFPQGFLGYHAEQVDSTLYVGFKFSGFFGIFETGDFDITIPTSGTITKIVVKSGEHEYTVWPKGEESLVDEADTVEDGIYIGC